MRTTPPTMGLDSTAFLLRQYRCYLMLDDIDEEEDMRAFLSIAQRLIRRAALPIAEAEAITRYIERVDRANSPDDDKGVEDEAHDGDAVWGEHWPATYDAPTGGGAA